MDTQTRLKVREVQAQVLDLKSEMRFSVLVVAEGAVHCRRGRAGRIGWL